MKLRALLQKSKKLKKIPHPEDVGLERTLERIFNHSRYRKDDFVDYQFTGFNQQADLPNQVLEFAKQMMYTMEIDNRIITTNQRTFAAFMSDHRFREAILAAEIPYAKIYDLESLRHFDAMVEMCRQYQKYLHLLQHQLPVTASDQLLAFSKSLQEELVIHPKVAELEQIVSNIDKPPVQFIFKAHIKLHYTNDYHREDIKAEKRLNYTLPNEITIAMRLATGEMVQLTDSGFLERSKFGIDYHKIFPILAKRLQGMNLFRRGRVDADVVFVMDYSSEGELENVTCKGKYRKSWRSLLPRWTRGTQKEFDLKLSYYEKEAFDFSTAIRYLKKAKYGKRIDESESTIEEFKPTVVQLRYLAILADVGVHLAKKGHPVMFHRPKGIEKKIFKGHNLFDVYLAVNDVLPDELNPQPNIHTPVGNDYDIDNSSRIQIITGMNFGGKSTGKRTVGGNKAFGQSGAFVLATDLEMSPSDCIYTLWNQQDDPEHGASTYTHQLDVLKHINAQASPYSLILLDDPFIGTRSDDGEHVLSDTLKVRRIHGSVVLVSTHYHNTAKEIGTLDCCKLRMCTFKIEDDGSVTPLYKIVDGFSDESHGYTIAVQRGMDYQGQLSSLEQRVENEKLRTELPIAEK